MNKCVPRMCAWTWCCLMAAGCSLTIDTQGSSCTSDEDCRAYSMECDQSRDPPVCVPPVDACIAGDSRCQDEVVQVCQPDEGMSGVMRWKQQEDCGQQGQVCDDDSGAEARCVEPCNDVCQPEGATRCEGDTVQICVGGDRGCLIWQDDTDCAQQGERCVDEEGEAWCDCVDTCSEAGETRCQDTKIQACTMGDDGCLDWVGQEDCALGGQLCDDTSGQATCVDECMNPCTAEEVDKLKCSDDQNDVLICLETTQDCIQWQVSMYCQHQTPPARCVELGGEPRCVAVEQHECTYEQLDTTRCYDNQVQQCQEGEQGYREWNTVEACEDSGLVCDEEGDSAQCVDPADIPEKTTILDGDFEQRPAGTVCGDLVDWECTQATAYSFVDRGCSLVVDHGKHSSGDKAFRSYVRGAREDECNAGGGSMTHTVETAAPRRTMAHHVTFFTSDCPTSAAPEGLYRLEIYVEFMDEQAVVTEEIRCLKSDSYYEPCRNGDHDDFDAMETGSDGQTWKRYTVEIPEEIDRSNLRFGVMHRAISGRCDEIQSELHIDRVYFSDADGNPLP